MADAYRRGDAVACAALFTTDAQLHSPFAPPAIGRNAIETLHQEWTQGQPSDKRFELLDAGAEGALAWAMCRYSETGAAEIGTSLLVLQRDHGGAWRIRSCCLYGDENTAS